MGKAPTAPGIPRRNAGRAARSHNLHPPLYLLWIPPGDEPTAATLVRKHPYPGNNLYSDAKRTIISYEAVS